MHFQIPDIAFTVDQIVAAAEQSTGLSAWGDLSFRQNLDVLLKSFLEEVPQADEVRQYFYARCLGLAQTRLLIEGTIRRHPEIEDVPIERPLIISGYPRTGTTILQNLLSLDPLARPLLYWESLQPVPPPEPETFFSDPRIAQHAAHLSEFYRHYPEWESIHYLTADGPNECENLFTFDFACTMFHAAHELPSFMKYILNRDMKPSYRFYKRLLQLLIWKFPGKRWVLKAPMHLPYLADLLEVLPDASLVVTHRDPCKVLASMCSLISGGRAIANVPGSVDKLRVGQEHLAMIPDIMGRYARLRKQLDPSRFFDIDYRDTVSDPVGLIRRIYAHFDYPFVDGYDQLIDSYLAEHRQHKRGRHQYSLEEFGLSQAEVLERFKPYTDSFPEIFAALD